MWPVASWPAKAVNLDSQEAEQEKEQLESGLKAMGRLGRAAYELYHQA